MGEGVEEMNECPTCHGKGKVESDSFLIPEAICPDCEGSGEVEGSDLAEGIVDFEPPF